MATGHTHPVIDGEITTLEEFAFECSKSFVWSFREGNTLTYPPHRDSYYEKRLPEVLAELAEWDSSSEEDKYRLWSEYAERVEEAGRQSKAAADAARDRLLPLIEAAKAKVVPETHKRFREFMIEQLEDTLKFDGTYKDEYHQVQPYGKWVDSKRGEILRSIRIYTEGMEKDEENYRASVEWISTLARLFNLEVKGGD